MDDDVGTHPASSWSLVSGLCQQMGIQVSTQRLSPGSHSALFGVSDLSLVFWVSACSSV